MGQSLGETIFWISAAACAAAETFILLSSFRAVRAQPKQRGVLWEALWAILPAIALAFVLSATWGAVHRGAEHERMSMPMAASNG